MVTLKVPRKWSLKLDNNCNAHTRDVIQWNVARRFTFKITKIIQKFIDRISFCTEIAGIDPMKRVSPTILIFSKCHFWVLHVIYYTLLTSCMCYDTGTTHSITVYSDSEAYRHTKYNCQFSIIWHLNIINIAWITISTSSFCFVLALHTCVMIPTITIQVINCVIDTFGKTIEKETND